MFERMKIGQIFLKISQRKKVSNCGKNEKNACLCHPTHLQAGKVTFIPTTFTLKAFFQCLFQHLLLSTKLF
jgi:hypothetical protein